MAEDRTLETSAPEDIPAVHADADRLRQVILSLVDNAVKYSANDGVIRLSARAKGQNRVEIQIQDNGIGIPADSLPHVFERFYRVDPSRARTQRRGGAGLGLSIAQSLVEAQGGAISIASVQGSGTTVTLVFPRARATRSTSAPPAVDHGSTPSLPAPQVAEPTP
jgi:signal transduction histidine kinase